MSDASFTGIERRRKTRASVKVIDRLASVLITVGGIGTILAVTLIMVFLVWVVLPLFAGSETGDATAVTSFDRESDVRPVKFSTDEYRTVGWCLFSNGTISVRSLATDEVLADIRPFGDRVPTTWSFAPGFDEVVFGFGDGTIQQGKIGFVTHFLEVEDFENADDAPEGVFDLAPGHTLDYRGGVIQRTPEGQYRHLKLAVEFEDPVLLRAGQAVLRVGFTTQEKTSVYVALTADGVLSVKDARRKTNLLTGQTTVKLSGSEFVLDKSRQRGVPSHLLVSGVGSEVYAVWPDGQLARYNIRDRAKPFEAELIDVVPEEGAELTAARWLIGKTSILIGDSLGRVSVWFPVTPEETQTVDGTQLVRAHRFEGPGGAVSTLHSSERNRLFSVGYDTGHVRLYHVTTENLVAEVTVEKGQPVLATGIAPKENAFFAATADGVTGWTLTGEHPDISIGALFTKVWYEGYPEPAHVWQSTGGTDDFEPKLGLMPLIFGTIKATIYSMLFGLPLALLAAIFASEFLHPRVKSKIKPTIEIMASLPSVVLGFLAGLVIAPFVEDIVPAVLTSFLTVPFAFLLGAYLWQLLPHEKAIALSRFRFPVICLCVPVGLLLAALLGPVVEATLFSGDIKSWLDGQVGTGFGGWFYLLLPISAVLAGLFFTRVFGNAWRRMSSNWDRPAAARADLVRFGAGIVLAMAFSGILAVLLTGLGLDPRGSLMATYVQRNALVVGFVMGFAIIPIIFTIAEDALSAVPEHLRSASLGAGATPWQTATRIIIPTAMSGLFSATMIGLGRAVGETMIVLMAAGNTPVMEWNIFNGFRTLSANLAVELPEAVKDSTHYRTLFFAALVLFAMTFVLNTVAEAVRQRFRKRAFEL
ncbi:MAG: ABC transporter permease subunit [Planctomycetota bacterium]